jgi:ribonucleotide reductase beta subunit family protein with ferritin-like domain
MSIFDRRVAFKPFEYPEVLEYKKAINHSYWLVSEWNFISDVHDFKVKLNDVEQNAIKNAMLAISQIEVSVKRFWTKLGDRFPKAEFEQVGVTFGECFIDGTEILTPNGWVDLKEIEVGDDVIQFSPDNTFQVTKVEKKIDQYYAGPMILLKKKTTVVAITPNHQIVYYKNGEYLKEQVQYLSLNDPKIKIPEAGKLTGGSQKEITMMDRLRIAIQADGNRRFWKNKAGERKEQRLGNGKGAEYEIRIKKKRKIKRLNWILAQLPGIEYTKAPIPSNPGMLCYIIRIDNEFNYKNMDWVNLHDKTHEWCESFIQEIAEWDGYRLLDKKDCKIIFSTTNKKVADVVQMAGVGAGYRANLMIREDKRKETYNDVYVVSFTANRERVSSSALKKTTFEYEGMVRCVKVQSGATITRYKNKTFIGSNSEIRHADAYSHLLEVLGLNDDFNQLLDVPQIKGRVEYLAKYIKGASDNNNEHYTLTLALFSIFIENVSLFSQFLVIKSFNKYMNILKDIDNVVQSTQREEYLHALLGVYLINQIKKEYPEWFNEDFYVKLYRACKKAYDAECGIIDWIFEAGELSFLPKDIVKEFIKNRFNESLEMIGGKKVFEVDQSMLEQLKWFDDEIHAEVNTDFFYKKPVTYSKKMQSIKAGDLF